MSGISIAGAVVDAATLAIVLSAVPLIPSLVVGLFVSIFQAATQIQDSTLSFVPKLVVTGALLYFCGPWMLEQIKDYTVMILTSTTELAR